MGVKMLKEGEIGIEGNGVIDVLLVLRLLTASLWSSFGVLFRIGLTFGINTGQREEELFWF